MWRLLKFDDCRLKGLAWYRCGLGYSGFGSASSRQSSAQALFRQIATVSIQLVEGGHLRPQHVCDRSPLLYHSRSSVKEGIIRTAWSRRESSPNKLENLLFEATRVEGNFLRKVAPQLRRESLEPVFQLLHPVRFEL